MIELELKGPPIAWAAPTVTRTKTFSKRSNAKAWSAVEVKTQYRGIALKGPVRLEIAFNLPMPTSWSQKKKLETDGYWHDVKPDADNLCKHVTDVLQKAGVLQNDSQVVSLHARKFWGMTGSTKIRVIPIGFRDEESLTTSDRWYLNE